MKKFIYVLIFILMVSCVDNQPDKINVHINNFSEQQEFVLQPVQNKSYVTAYIKIKGFANDTVKIDAIRTLELIGKFDTIIRTDYYGGHDIKINFNPYKATSGEIRLTGTL